MNILAAPVYVVYIHISWSRYSRACGSYQDFLDRVLLLIHRFIVDKLSLRKFYGGHHDLVNHCGIHVSQMNTDMFYYCNHNPVLSSFMTYHWVCCKNNTTGEIIRTGTSSRSPRFLVGFVLLNQCSVQFLVGFVLLNQSVQCLVYHCLYSCPFLVIIFSVLFNIYGFWIPLWYLQTFFIDKLYVMDQYIVFPYLPAPIISLSVVFFWYPGCLHQLNWPPRYTWNIVEGGVKYHNPNPPPISLYHGMYIRVITKLPNSEQSYKGKVKTHNYIKTKSVNNQKNVKTVMTLTWYRHF